MSPKVLGLILAGGLSRRMGGSEKSFIELSGITLLDRVINRLNSQVSKVVLNANGDISRFQCYDVPVVCDEIEGYPGPLAGVLAGMEFARKIEYEWVVSVAVDTPFFPKNMVKRLLETSTKAPISLAAIVDKNKGIVRQPTFGLWSVSLSTDLRAALVSGMRKIVEWTDQYDPEEVVFPHSPINPFYNVNTPGDLLYAEKILKSIQ